MSLNAPQRQISPDEEGKAEGAEEMVSMRLSAKSVQTLVDSLISAVDAESQCA